MCPMCDRRSQLFLQQQEQQMQQQHRRVLESSLGSSPASIKPSGNPPSTTKGSLFRSPFQSCKNLSHQCCSPVCESQRTSLHSVRRSSVRPSVTPDHSGEFAYLQHAYRLLESPHNGHPSLKENHQPFAKPSVKTPPRNSNRNRHPKTRHGAKKPRGLLTRLKLLTQGAASQQGEVGSADSSFISCGRKVLAVAVSPEPVLRGVSPSPPVVALETSLDTPSEASLSEAETNVSESTMISMWNLHGSLRSWSYRGSTLKSSPFEDDASTFAIIPCTSTNSPVWSSGASDGLFDRFEDLDLGYSSLEESGEGPDIDDTISISSLQCEDLEPLETFLESDFDQDNSIGSDSLERLTERKDPASVLQWPRGNVSKNHLHLHLPELETTAPSELAALAHDLASLSRHNSLAKEDFRQAPDEEAQHIEEASMEVMRLDWKNQPTMEYLCSRCGRKEKKPLHDEKQTTKNVSHKQNPMSAYFSTFMDGEDQAVIAAKVVVLLGKYGNRRGLRFAGSHSHSHPRRSLRIK